MKLGLPSWRSLFLFAAACLTFITTLHLQRFGWRTFKPSLPTEDDEEVRLLMDPCRGASMKSVSRVSSDGIVYALEDTTCSGGAYARGTGQKVVAFSFFGDTDAPRGYFKGVEKNAVALPTAFPGFSMRLYVDFKQQGVKEQVCAIAQKYDWLDVCDINGVPKLNLTRVVNPMIWRFFPSLDPQVDVLLSRDLDEDLSVRVREVVATREWLDNSTQPVHSMRDHPMHGVPMLGGLWGTHLLRKDARAKWRESWSKILPSSTCRRSCYGHDQRILHKFVWDPWAKSASLVHDSYLCGRSRLKGAEWRPFPTRRDGSELHKEDAKFAGRPQCPVECRPPEHKDWTFC